MEGPLEPAAGANGRSFPWPPRTDGAWLDALARTWQQSVFAPSAFFAVLPRAGGGLGAAVLYYLIIGVVSAAVRLFWRLIFATLFADADSPLLRALRMGEAGSPLVDFLLTPLVLLITLGLAALITHFALWVVGGAREGLGTTTTVLGYSVGPQLFVVVPLLGTVVASFWSLVLLVIGLREAHGTSTARAVIAVLLPVLALVGLFVLLLLALLAAGAGGRLVPGLPDPAG